MNQQNSSAVLTRSLRRTFGTVTAIDDLSFQVERGQLFTLLGPNGAGKSTTIQIITTLMEPTAGAAFVGGFDVARQAREVRQRIGVVFQDSSLDDRLTARENLQLQAAIFGLSYREGRDRARQKLGWMGLDSAADAQVRTFSGGMRRRLEIARALLHEPEVLILDEPTVGLDPQTRRLVWDHLLAIAEPGDRTVFVTTHYMDEAERCDDVAILDHGRMVARGSPRELMGRLAADRLVVRVENEALAREVALEHGYDVTDVAEGLEVRGGKSPEIMLTRLAERGVGVREARAVRGRLEDAFVALTGRELRDAPDGDGAQFASMRAGVRARRGR